MPARTRLPSVLSLFFLLLSLGALAWSYWPIPTTLEEYPLVLSSPAVVPTPGLQRDRSNSDWPWDRSASSPTVTIELPRWLRVEDPATLRVRLSPSGPTGESLAQGSTIVEASVLAEAGSLRTPAKVAGALLPGKGSTLSWKLAPRFAGEQQFAVALRLRFISKDGSQTEEELLWARSLTLEAHTLLGLTTPTTKRLAAIGGILSLLLILPLVKELIH